jgi:thiosulfate/3-mercaptopyruvate sulfurtransferase
MRILPLLACLLAIPAWATGDLGYTAKVGSGETVIDTRPLADCQRASMPGARCLPPADLLGPQRSLPTERNLLWLFGALGLSGEETVLVAGDTASGRDFVAGLLYLSGQRKVRVLDRPLTPLVAARPDAVAGETRALVRTAVFTAPMRDALWIVHPEDLDDRAGDTVILAADAYTAIIRFTRHVAAGQPVARVGWHPYAGNINR